ncbi:hypothetical protein ZWY2020_005838 [Hordeum vulgare]|nr:hypothetical protein ZWY2020_005838 [Hordeum vulgare]
MATNKSIKSVVICVLILGLVLEQVQVEGKSCCKNTTGRNCYNACRFAGGSRPVCATACGCKIISSPTCPRDYPKLNLLLNPVNQMRLSTAQLDAGLPSVTTWTMVQVEGKSCCKNTTGRNCYNACRFAGGSRPVCATACGCKIISGPTCPRDYPKLNLLPESGEPNATEYCTIGCRTSVCDNMDNVSGGQEMKFDMGLCSNACARFCNDGEVIQSVEA